MLNIGLHPFSGQRFGRPHVFLFAKLGVFQ